LARKILLADDSVTAQNMGRKILADAGYDVITVNNGSAALKRIAEVKPDLIVLDVYMPGYSGLEVCQRLKESAETSHIPVLLTVGKLEPFKPEEARRAKADAHIVKPFEASELLTAITRLEDRVVPQQAESTDPDTGWKSRLRFPSKKKKEEPEPERDDFVPTPAFRDFRKGKAKTETREAFVGKAAAAPPPEPEPAVVPDIPRDITPEELDALSALAAKLDGPVAAENAAPVADKTELVEAPAEEVAAATVEVETPAAVAEAETAAEREEVEAPATPAVETVELTAAPIEAPALAVEATHEVESPVEHAEPAIEITAVVAEPPAVVEATVNTAPLAQEPAPVDRDDEPRFASATTEAEPAEEDKAEEKIEIIKEEKPAEELPVPEMPAPPVAVAETVEEPAVEELAPSDVELAEALRLLTPATGHGNGSTVSSPEALVAAGQAPPEEAVGGTAAGARWVAEPVTLSSEEAAISLEAEMFSTFTAKPTATPVEESEPVRITGVQAIVAAVENRLAEAGIAATTGLPEQEAGHGSAGHGSADQGSAETSVAEAPAEVMAAVPNAEKPSEGGVEPEIEKESKAEKIEAERENSPENVSEQEPGGATFANAVDWEKIEATAEQNGEPADEATAAVAEQNQDSSSDDGGQESMSTDGKAKGKSNWRQIHTAPASATAKTDVVEAAKQAQAEEAPKVMAAAAAEGSATDASSIASIVDSVLADLRPKIVEEIAKKLAGK